MDSISRSLKPEPEKGQEDSIDSSALEKGFSDNAERDATEQSTTKSENELTGIRLLVVHASLCLCTFLVGLDFNFIATAVPAITSRFGSIGDVGWYGGAYFLALCASMPLAGKMYTLFSKKIIFLACVGIFEIGSLVCALAPTSDALVVGRAIAGLGASGIYAGGLVILTTIIPLHKRAVWQGTLNSTFAVASIAGPVLGGALTEHLSWRWCFYINFPIGAVSAVVVLVFLKLKPGSTENGPLAQKLKNLDAIGFILFAGSVTMLLLALQWGGTTYAWKSSVVIGLFIGFGIVMSVFAAWQLYLQDDALIPPKISANRNVALIFLSALFANGPFQTVVYWLPIWFQAILGVTPTSSGVRYLPTVIADVLISLIGSGIVMKLGTWNPFLLLGIAIMSVGSGLLTTLYPGVPDSHWIGFQILCGSGYSLVINMAHLGVQASLPPDLVPVGATTLLFGMSTSCAIFLAAGQSVFQERLAHDVSQVVPEDTVNAILSVGATQIRSVISPQQIVSVTRSYSSAVTEVFFIPAVGPALSFLFICGTTWVSIKKSETEKLTENEKEEANTL